MNIKLMTINCWGLKIFSKHRKERLTAIASQVKDYDLATLQEVWSKDDFIMMRDLVGSCLPYSHMFYSCVIGSGMCVFSRYPIVGTDFHQFMASGGLFDLYTGEVFAGKGVGMCRVLLADNCYVSLYTAHTNPELRESQLFECMQFVDHTRGRDMVVMTGDLNTTPNQCALKLLTTCLDLQDAFHHGDCDEDCCVTCSDLCTCDREDNVFRAWWSLPERIDYVLFANAGSDWELNMRMCSITMHGLVEGTKYNYSDHIGLKAEFIVRGRKDFVLQENGAFFSEHKQIIFRELKDAITKKRDCLSKQCLPHSVLIWSWIFMAICLFALSYSCFVGLPFLSPLSACLLCLLLWLCLIGNIIGSMFKLSQLSALENNLNDLHYYMNEINVSN